MKVSLIWALNAGEAFRPGLHACGSSGRSHAFTAALGSILQLNVLSRRPEGGAQSEPDNSGLTTGNLSPGLTLGIGHRATICAHVQLPLYQHVTGTQLVPRRAAALGWTMDL